MLQRLRTNCLIGSIALIGADRIDLLTGHGPFTLTPFLFFAAMAILCKLLSKALNGSAQFAPTPPMQRQAWFPILLALFLFFLLASVPFGIDPESGAMRCTGLLVVAGLGYYISVQILAEPAPEKLILCSVAFGLILYLLFCVGECISFFNGIYLSESQTLTWQQLVFAPMNAGLLPRLSGTTVDPNRAGFLLTMYLVLLDRFTVRRRFTFVLRSAIALLVLLTLSKSAILCWLVYYLFSRGLWARLSSRSSSAMLATAAVAISSMVVMYPQKIENLGADWGISDLISNRMDITPGSSGESHIALIQRGFEVWQSSPLTIISGIGFGSSYKVLGDFFGTNRYGNFHCLYVTILAESGIFALILLLVILCCPAFTRKGAARCILAIMVFNISYQSHTEPLFWLVLALLWSFERREPRWPRLPAANMIDPPHEIPRR